MSANDYYNNSQPTHSGNDYERGNYHPSYPNQEHQRQQYSQGHQSGYSDYEGQQQQYRQGYQQSHQSGYSPQPSYDSPSVQDRPVGQQYGDNYHNAAAARPQDYNGPADDSSHSGGPSEYGRQPYVRHEQAQYTQYKQSYDAQGTYNSNYSSQQPPACPPSGDYHRHNQPHHGQQPPQYGYQEPANPQLNPQDSADKGFMGAVAGGALGGYGGHKLNHGFIGTVGGAIAGSKLEDHFKDKKKDKKKKRRGSNSSCSSSSSSSSSSDDERRARRGHQPQVLAGNFSASSESISLDGDYDLIASCRTASGHTKLSAISLNDVLANMSGNFAWAKGGHFGATARNARLVDDGRVLEAELGDGGATAHGWRVSRIRLDERITNQDGELKFLG